MGWSDGSRLVDSSQGVKMLLCKLVPGMVIRSETRRTERGCGYRETLQLQPEVLGCNFTTAGQKKLHIERSCPARRVATF